MVRGRRGYRGTVRRITGDDLVLPGPDAALGGTVHRIYRSLAEAFSRKPRVAPAMLAEGLAGEVSAADNFLRAVAT
jgi:hypothetical protein